MSDINILDIDLFLFETSTLHKIELGVLPVSQQMLIDAELDPALTGVVLSRPVKRLSISVDGVVVGFLSPRRESTGHWRTGAIYITPAHRNLGYGSTAIQKFFKDKELGRALIEPLNVSSQKAFASAGFHFKRNFISDNVPYQVWEKRSA